MTERGIAFAKVFNFRDLGGYRTGDGRTVRWHRLFRSDDLSRLGDDDRERFSALGIRTVVDLRRPNEVEEDGRIPAFDGFTYHHVHLVHSPWQPRDFVDTADRAAYVLARYRDMSVESADGIGRALRLIADADTAPLVFHCIAGKDRTGVVSALTLSLLGVPDDTIADDYHLSELAEPSAWALYNRDRPDRQRRPRRHITSPREAMLDFLAYLRRTHGSIEAYAASAGVTSEHITAMRSHLLQDASDPAVRVGGAPTLNVHEGLSQ